MEIFGAISGAIGVADVSLKVSMGIIDYVKHAANAPEEMGRLSVVLGDLIDLLEKDKRLRAMPGYAMAPSDAGRIAEHGARCNASLEEIRAQLAKLGEKRNSQVPRNPLRKAWNRVRWPIASVFVHDTIQEVKHYHEIVLMISSCNAR
jgi:hypothetical protein